MRRVLIGIVLALVMAIAIVVGVGYALPVAHVASRDAVIAQPPDRVFATIADVEQYPEWRTGVTRVELLSRSPVRWRESGDSGDITFEVQQSQPPARLVTRIADPDLPFGGTWSYELSARGTGTGVTITEHGEVYNPVFRVLSRFVFGHTATMQQFLDDLVRRLR
jgi:uncharacterized protein YndB with AHSA1/START domain